VSVPFGDKMSSMVAVSNRYVKCLKIDRNNDFIAYHIHTLSVVLGSIGNNAGGVKMNSSIQLQSKQYTRLAFKKASSDSLRNFFQGCV
jgi:hypothetical protein